MPKPLPRISPSHDEHYSLAQRHLASTHTVFARLIEQHGPCTLRPMPDLFQTLVNTVISQQISTKAALAINAKVTALCGKPRLTPERLLQAKPEQLQACGLSAGKLRTLLGLAKLVARGKLDLKKLKKLDDDGVANQLLPIHGIGPWSVDMILIFGLGRLDILPVGDLGFRVGVKEQFGLPVIPSVAELNELSTPWRPYRTVATWYLWRSRGPVPSSD